MSFTRLLPLVLFWPGGGNRKVFALFHATDESDLCLGVIGSTKFCIKKVEAGGKTCGVAAHAKNNLGF